MKKNFRYRFSSFWASAPKGADALCSHHMDILPFHHVTSCYVTSHPPPLSPLPPPPRPPMLPFGMEGCPCGEDTENRPLWEPMPFHTGTPRRWGIRVPMLITLLQRLDRYNLLVGMLQAMNKCKTKTCGYFFG
jgi:hypothetical protein